MVERFHTNLRPPLWRTRHQTNGQLRFRTDLENYSDGLHVAMSCLRLSPPRATNQKDTFQYKELDTCSHVFLQRIAIAPPLTAPYDGPYKVVTRSGRVLKVLIKGKVEMVTADRVKPAHIECTPEDELTRQ